jgi:hypothetical protein
MKNHSQLEWSAMIYVLDRLTWSKYQTIAAKLLGNISWISEASRLGCL